MKAPPSVTLFAGGRGHSSGEALAALMSSSRKTGPSVAYVGAASGDSAPFRWMMTRLLRSAGAGEIRPVPLRKKTFRREEAERILSSADLVYFSGGDVEAGMAVLEARGLVPFLAALHGGGKPCFGHSAGSILLAREWVRWRDAADAASAERFPCLGLAPILCDTHGEDEGWEELKALLLLEPEGTVGHGLRSGAAMAVSPDGRVEILEGRVDRFIRTASGVLPLGG